MMRHICVSETPRFTDDSTHTHTSQTQTPKACVRQIKFMRLAPTPAILLLVASVHCALPLRNGGFEEGLRHWNVTCAPAERCGSAAVELYEGSKVAALQATADQWTSMQLQQKLDGSFTGEDAIDVKASVRAGAGTWRAPMEMKLSVVYEGMGSCQVSRLVLPTSWEDLRVRCAPARGAARQSSTVAWVVIEFACVRSEATLLVDNVVATTGNVRDDGSSAPSVMTAAIAAPEVPRILHFVFGLSSDFGSKPLVWCTPCHQGRSAQRLAHRRRSPRTRQVVRGGTAPSRSSLFAA